MEGFFNRKMLAAHGLALVAFFPGIFNVSNGFYKKMSLLTSGIYFVAEEFPLLAISFGNGVLPG